MSDTRLEEAIDLRREVDALERRILELRARIRVRDPLPIALDVVECEVGEDRMAIPVDRVDRVLPAVWLSPIPEAPAWVPGLLHVQGSTLPVIDVLARFRRNVGPSGTPAAAVAREIDPADRLVVVNVRGGRVALLVQGVSAASRIDSAAIEESSDDVPRPPYVRGTYVAGGGVVILLDVDALVSAAGVPGEVK